MVDSTLECVQPDLDEQSSDLAVHPDVARPAVEFEVPLDELRFQPHPALRDGDPELRAIQGEFPMAVPACPVCRSQRALPVVKIVGMPQRLVECVDCGLGSLNPLPGGGEVCRFYPPDYYGEPGAKFQPAIERLLATMARRTVRRWTRGLPDRASVLDIGCGRGVYLNPLVEAGFDGHGVELSRQAATGCDPRADVRIAGDLSAAGFRENQFDLILICHVLEHLRDPVSTLREVRRILKPGGRLVVSVPNYASWQGLWAREGWFHLDLPRHLYHFPEAALLRLLSQLGLPGQSVKHWSFSQNPYGWVQSLQNRCRLWPRNELYRMLHAGQSLPWTWRRGLLKLAYWLGMPLALGLSAVAAASGRGATIEVQARADSKQRAVRRRESVWAVDRV